MIQAAGGAIASGSDDNSVIKTGGNIMLGGIVFQVGTNLSHCCTSLHYDSNDTVVMTAFIAFSTEFMWRYFKDVPVSSRSKESSQVTLSNARKGDYTGAMRFMVYALAVDSVLLYIRYAFGSFPTERRAH